MRMLFRTTLCALVVLAVAPVQRAFAQKWTIPLHNVNLGNNVDCHDARSVAFMPDGKTIATAGVFFDARNQQCTGEIRFFDTRSGAVTGTLERPDASYSVASNNMSVSPDGRTIVVGGRHGKLDVATWSRVVDAWDVEGRRLRATIPIPLERSSVFSVDLSPDGKVLLLATASGHVRAIDVATNNTIWEMADVGSQASWSPDGRLVAVGFRSEARVLLLDAATGARRGEFPVRANREALERPEACGFVRFAADGRLAVAIAAKGELGGPVRVCRPVEIRGRRDYAALSAFELGGHGEDNHIYLMQFSRDGKLLASCGQDNCVRLWDLESRKQRAVIQVHKDFVYGVQFSPDGRGLVSVARDSLHYCTLEEILNPPEP